MYPHCNNKACIDEVERLCKRVMFLESQLLSYSAETEIIEDALDVNGGDDSNVNDNDNVDDDMVISHDKPSVASSLNEDVDFVNVDDEMFLTELVSSIFCDGHVATLQEQYHFGLLIQRSQARLVFARLLNNLRTGGMLLSDETFYRLVQFVSVALNECSMAEDFSPARTLMNLCFTFYREVAGTTTRSKEFLHTELNGLPIWQSIRFWEAAFFDAVACECNRANVPILSLSDSDRENSRISDCNVIFGQLACFVTNMASLGVHSDEIDEFVDKMALIGGLNDEQLALLSECLDNAAPRTVVHVMDKDIFGEGVSAREDEKGRLVIGAIRFGSPAAGCEGLATNDRIFSLNGQSCAGMTVVEFNRSLKEFRDRISLVVFKPRDYNVAGLRSRSCGSYI